MNTLIIILVILSFIGLIFAIVKLTYKFWKKLILQVIGTLFLLTVLYGLWQLIWWKAPVGQNQVYLDYIKSGHAIQKDIPNRKNTSRQIDLDSIHIYNP